MRLLFEFLAEGGGGAIVPRTIDAERSFIVTSNSRSSTPQIAVWYFIGATFIFAASTLFFPDAPLWIRISCLALGFLVVVAGGFQLGREIRQRGDGRTVPPESGAATR